MNEQSSGFRDNEVFDTLLCHTVTAISVDFFFGGIAMLRNPQCPPRLGQ